MYIDKEMVFSEKQAVTTSVASTNVIDLGATNSNVNQKHYKTMPIMDIVASVDTDFAGGTSLQVVVETADVENFATKSVMSAGEVVPVATLKAGYRFRAFPSFQMGVGRYVRAYYTVVGTMSAGKINCFVTMNSETI